MKIIKKYDFNGNQVEACIPITEQLPRYLIKSNTAPNAHFKTKLEAESHLDKIRGYGFDAELIELKNADDTVTQDLVNHPAHYTRGKVETIDGLESAVEGLQGKEAGLTWQVIRYMWRWKFKDNPLQDLKKAEFYLKRLINYVEVGE